MYDEIDDDFSEINTDQANSSFQRGLKQGKTFISALQLQLLGSIENDEDMATNAFDAFEKFSDYLETKNFKSTSNYKSLTINSLLSFGLDSILLDRVKFYCIQIEARSPSNQISLFFYFIIFKLHL